ncbi:ABC transporter permease [Devosia ginsengisoli]|uniref:Autoinducer 2 import system permease protein LsrD n=1 Tax=Devosia ginsengisoli TaxID=400770 RepID=A0A5B8LXX8_9HYPH|nr:ABC transporter permease [Devosia ginsengisoli]QDZ12661.1 ABC transporter permease [Devosia ginsengisoli]
MTRFLTRHSWSLGLFAILVILLVATRIIQPNFGASGLDSLARAALPFAFATIGMGIVVIAGGIDLSVASIMAVAGVIAALLMQQMGDASAGLVVLIVLLAGVTMGAINGLLIVLTRVPDIVVTLAMLFVWEGVALLILNAPGGTAAPWLRALVVGGVTIPGLPPELTAWLPRAFVVLVAFTLIIWLPLRRSKLGLSIYAIGSDQNAAFRSGVPIGLTRVAAYAFAGLFAALGGLSITLSTGIGEPIAGPYLLASVAAVVLGGISLTGGRGGLLGPIIAVFILRTLRLDLTLLSVDPNVTTIIEGIIMVAVVMIGGLLAMRGPR